MRLTKQSTEDLVKEVAGEDTVKLVGLLKDKSNISEFKLAEKLRLTVNTVRNMLYKLQEHNLVSSTRKKDKKKGWYIYYWTFNVPQARTLARVVKEKKLEDLKRNLETETQESFYACPERCIRLKIENAMDYDFKCPECGTILQEDQNELGIEKLRNTIKELEDELAGKLPLEQIERRGRPRLKKRGRPKLKVRGRSRLKTRRRPKLKMRGRPRLKMKRRHRLKMRGRPKLIKSKIKRIKLIRKSKTARKLKSKRLVKRVRKARTIKRIPKRMIKKKGLLKRVKRFLKRR